jgi:hypothetical protein
VPSKLRFDNATQGASDKKRIIDPAGSGRELAHGDAKICATVHLFARLHQPVGLGQLAIDHYPSAVFGMENALPHDRVHAIVARPDFEQPASHNFNESASYERLTQPQFGFGATQYQAYLSRRFQACTGGAASLCLPVWSL